MDGIATILRLQWQSHWRSLVHSDRANKQGWIALLIFSGIFLYKFLIWVNAATQQLLTGNGNRLELLLTAMFFVGLLPALADTTAYLPPKTLLRFPFPINTLFSIRLLSTCMAPFSWLVLLAWLLLAGPLSRSQHPAEGLVSLALLLLMSHFLGFTLANAAVLSALRMRFFAAAGALLSLAIYLLSSGRNIFGIIALLPPGLVERTAMGRNAWLPLSLLAALSFVTLLLARQTFVLALYGSEQIVRQAGPNRALKLLWWTVPMFVKEIRYCRYGVVPRAETNS